MNKFVAGAAGAIFSALLLSTSALAQSECTGTNCPKAGAEGSADTSGAAVEGRATAQGGARVKGSADAPATGATSGETTGSTSGETQEGGATVKSESTSKSDANATASAKSDVNVTVEQKTEIKQVIREVNVEPVHVDFDISVGVAVPQTIVLHPLPPRLVEIVPAYRGYLFFVTADGTIVIVAPDTHDVVYVIA